MSSWVRDMAIKPPQKPEPMQVLETPTLMISEPGPVRVFEMPARRKPVERFFPLVEPYPQEEEQQNAFVVPFDYPSRIKFGQKQSPRVMPEPFQKKEPVRQEQQQQPYQQKLQQQQQQQQPQPYQQKPKPNQAPTIAQLNKPEDPLITIVLECSKDTEFLEASIQSFSRQTYNNWVGTIALRSKDNKVLETVNSIVSKLQLGNIFTVLSLDEQTSSTTALQAAIDLSKTKYIAFATSNDLWVSKKLEQQVEELEKDDCIGLVGTMSRFFGDRVELAKVPPGLLNEDDFKAANPLIFPSILMRREYAILSDDYAHFDFECWVRNITQGVIMTNLQNILTLQRVNQIKQITKNDDKDIIRAKYGLA